MKKTLIALAAVAVSGAAFAQATISGSIHVGIIDTGAAGFDTRVDTLGGGVNAINIGTSEDLGNGLRAGFTGQIRFNAATGNMNSALGAPTGTALLHASNVFVGGNFGTVRIGKIAEAGLCAFDPWGCTGGASLQAGVGVSSLIASSTQAHSLSYASPNFSGFSGSFQTSLSPRDNERQVLSLNYAQGPLAVGFVRANSGVMNGATMFTTNDDKRSQQGLAASYDFGVARVFFTNVVTKADGGAKEANVTSLGLSAPVGPVTVLAGYSKDREAASNEDTKLSLGVVYNLSKRTFVGADVFRAEQGAGTGTGYVFRVRHAF